MSIEGRINVDALFHDKDGTTSLKVVSLRSSDEYTIGKVAIVTATAGTSSVTISPSSPPYRDASGNLVPFNHTGVSRIAFAWSGSSPRYLSDGEQKLILRSVNGQVALTSVSWGGENDLEIASGTGTGTYTIVLYGT